MIPPFPVLTQMLRLLQKGLSPEWLSSPGPHPRSGTSEGNLSQSHDLWKCVTRSGLLAAEALAEVAGLGARRKDPGELGPAGNPENSGVAHTVACRFIFSGMRGPEGTRGMWESYFSLCLADGTSSSFCA